MTLTKPFPDDDQAAGRPYRRAGVTLLELIVSAVVLITIMTFITSICFRTNLIWKDIGHHRAAVNELSNHLERLTSLTTDEAKQALISLEPSAFCANTLNQPELTGRFIEDKLGIRIAMQIDWKRQHPGPPVQLVGWMIPSRMGTETSETSLSTKRPANTDSRLPMDRETPSDAVRREVIQ